MLRLATNIFLIDINHEAGLNLIGTINADVYMHACVCGVCKVSIGSQCITPKLAYLLAMSEFILSFNKKNCFIKENYLFKKKIFFYSVYLFDQASDFLKLQ